MEQQLTFLPDSLVPFLSGDSLTVQIVSASYVLGSVPFGLLLSFLFGYGDIRRIGSGNIGATNALRTGNKLLGFLTFFFDFLKGFVAVSVAASLQPQSIYLAMIFVVIGHMFPVWLRFKGGKGVATTLGVVLGVDLVLGLVFIGVWLGVAVVSRYSSLAALSALVLVLISALVRDVADPLMIAIFVIFAFVFFRHAQNIVRLISGDETKIGARAIEPSSSQAVQDGRE